MDQETWSKSLLATYNALPLVVKCIDRSNMQMALGSFSYQGNALDLMNKMIANNARKEALINAKVIVDNTLAMLKPKHKLVLEMRYIKRKSFEQIATLMNICLRSVFRWHELALKQFSSLRIMKGYDDEWLSKYYADDPVFVKCFRYCAEREEQEREERRSLQKQNKYKENLAKGIAVALGATSRAEQRVATIL
ncbi:MAG: hypothetical protein K2L52_00985 [Clostridia bacterium]|nr:hypothetical protein [Clostridia bacterium]